MESGVPYSKCIGFLALVKTLREELTADSRRFTQIEIRARGYTAESQVPIKVYYKENVVGEYIRKSICDNRRKSAVKYTPNARTYARRA